MKDPMLKLSRRIAAYAEKQAAKLGHHVECMALDIKFDDGSTLRAHSHPIDDVTSATFTTHHDADEARPQ
jgi:hypothetical protein